MKIERNIPYTPQRQPRLTALLKKMKKGDSLRLPSDSWTERNAWYQAAHRLGVKITIRTTTKGVRLWRT